MIKSVLFDLDGTLLDTAEDLSAALNHILMKYDLPTIDKAISRPLASDGAKGLIELGFGEALNHFNYEELRQQFLRYYENNIAVNTTLYTGVTELLAGLDKSEIPWGIVTNKPEALAVKLIAFYPELATSKILIGGDSLSQRKPDPMPIIAAFEHINSLHNQTLYIGDALRDIQASNAAGTISVVANWGYIKNTDNVHEWNADFIFDNPLDILQLIK